MTYPRILLKLSGEFLGSSSGGFCSSATAKTAKEISSSLSAAQTAVLVGGGNIIRARTSRGIERLSADYMGITATLINAIGLKDAFKKIGVESVILSAFEVRGVAEPVNPEKAVKYLENGTVVIFAGGTGSPFFTTDTAAALRALEIKASAVLKATKVDGVYDMDPEKHKAAKLMPGELKIEEALSKGLQVMDAAAFSILKGSGIDIVVFNFHKDGALKKVLEGEKVGTVLR